MSIQEASAEQLAELFHHYHAALGTDFGCAADPQAESWEQVPPQARSRMLAAARLSLQELMSIAGEAETSRRYFARPGEAEWGC